MSSHFQIVTKTVPIEKATRVGSNKSAESSAVDESQLISGNKVESSWPRNQVFLLN
jgi:hypothetical protein